MAATMTTRVDPRRRSRALAGVIATVALTASAMGSVVPASAAIVPTLLGAVQLSQSGGPVSAGTVDQLIGVTTGACPATDGASHATNYVGITLSGGAASAVWSDVPVLTTTNVGVSHSGTQSFQLSDTFRAIATSNSLPLPLGSYELRVTCQDVFGVNVSGHYSVTVTFDSAGAFVAGVTTPTAPRSPVSSPLNRAAVLRWTAPASPGATAVTGYVVLASPGGRSCATTGALTCRVTGLVNGRAYTFVVRARNAAGLGPWSARTLAVIAGTPSTPLRTAVRFASRTSTTAQVTWAAPASIGGGAVTSYQVRWSLNGRTTWTTWKSTRLTRAIAIPSARYGKIQIRALNRYGAGPAALVTFRH